MEITRIVNSIKEYIEDDKAHYAVMINGPWGCGKTYLYENYVKKEIEKNESGKSVESKRELIYVSLYGVESVETLTKDILLNCIVRNNKNIKKSIKVVGNIISLISNAVSFSTHGISISMKDVKKDCLEIINNLVEPKQLIICFDDLERCCIPIRTIFGYINNFVEHCRSKVIIIADEGNIGKQYANESVENKYQVVLTGWKGIKIDENEIIGGKKSEDTEKHDAISLDELKKRTEYVFSENYVYNDIKEKVVGKTFFYSPQLDVVYDEIVNKYPFYGNICGTEQIRSFLNDKTNKDSILEEFKFCRCNNVRIFLMWLRSVDKLIKCVQQYRNEECGEEFTVSVLNYSVYYICRKMKNEKLIVLWGIDGKYPGNVIGKYDTYFWDKDYAFGFVDEIMGYDNIDYNALASAFNAFSNEKRKEDKIIIEEFGAYSDLEENCWFLNDEELEAKIVELEKEIDDGKYSYKDYRKILYLIFKMVQEGMVEDIMDDITYKMVNSVKNCGIESVKSETPLDFSSKEEKMKFNKYYSQIADAMEDNIKDKDLDESRADSVYLNYETFKKHLETVKKDRLNRMHGFIKYIDFDKFMGLLEKLSKKEVYELSNIIYNVYSYHNVAEYGTDEIESIQELINCIESCGAEAFEGRTGMVARKYMIKRLNDIIT